MSEPGRPANLQPAHASSGRGLLSAQFVLAVAVLVAVLAGLQMVAILSNLLAVLFLGMVLGLTLSPLVEWLSRFKIPAVVAVLVVYGLVAGSIGLLGWVTWSSVAEELERLDEVEGTYRELADDLNLPTIEELRAFLNANAGTVAGTLGSRFSAWSRLCSM